MSLHDRLMIEEARRQKANELLKEYDEFVYKPALAALKAKDEQVCAEKGHIPAASGWHDNGCGWRWLECHRCHIRIDEECLDWDTRQWHTTIKDCRKVTK